MVSDPPQKPPSTSAGCEPEPVISVTDPSQPQPSISAGYGVPAPDQTPRESIEATADR